MEANDLRDDGYLDEIDPTTSPLPRNPIGRRLKATQVKTEGAGFEPAEGFPSPVFKTAHFRCYDWVLGGSCLGFCHLDVELCRRSRPKSTCFGSPMFFGGPCSADVMSGRGAA